MRFRPLAATVVALSAVGLALTTFAAPALAGTPAVPRTVCSRVHRAHEVVVDLSRQRAWFCRHGRQVRSTPVTTGAVRRG